jgi:hypothetical protein
MKSKSRAMTFAIAVVCAALLTSGCSVDQAPERFGLTGMVTVDGKPAHRMIVQLTHLDPQIGERERYVSSKSNEAGEFIFGDRADGTPSGFQGAVAGKYAVTFSWMSSDEIDAVDQLKGRFAEASQSKFEVTVPVEPTAAPLVFAIKSRP